MTGCVLADISGRLRSGSLNTRLLAAALAPTGCRVDELSIRDIPLYDGDLADEASRQRRGTYMEGFAEFTAAARRA